MIWIIGGTSEGRELVENIADLEDQFLVTVATESGGEFIDTKYLEIGRMDLEAMRVFIAEKNIKLIVDLTHPFAKIVSENARKAADDMEIDYLRYTREKINPSGGILVNSYEEAYDYIKDLEGIIFFTTGSNKIEEFEKVKGEKRHIYRVLPAIESIEKCRDSGVHIRDIVAILGPFSQEANKFMFQEYKADYVVMKDSGRKGGTEEKINACSEMGIRPIIIDRGLEEGIKSLKELENSIRNFI